MQKQVWEYVKSHRLIEAGDHVVVGVSGGADSVCLLLILEMFKEHLAFSTTVVHVEHGFRGKESLEDAEFVENFCKVRGIPCRVFHVNMEEKARVDGLSLEEAGRALRYDCFLQVCREYGANKIAVAHHRDDQAETVLHHLFRGSGLRGLCGMAPMRQLKDTEIRVIRPLLEVGREEIEEWLIFREIPWRTDQTNEEEIYTRNKLRHLVLPLVEKEVQPKAGAHVAQAAGRLLLVQEYLDTQAAKAYECCAKQAGEGIRILLQEFLQQEPLMQTMVLQRVLEEMRQGLKDITAVHLKEILTLAGKETGKVLFLPHGIRARREYGWLILEPEMESSRKRQDTEESIAVTVPGTYLYQEFCWKFTLETPKKCQGIPEKTYTKWFDYDKIEKCLAIRTRKPGDFLEINGEHGRKKIKDYYMDLKIPREERDELPLLADGSHVIWIPGYRISEGYKVTERTRRMLRVELSGGITND